ncbi:Proteasome subunit beta type-7 [Cichlidogyrus casuarinus]|uniref:Proteasome subunit beta n=1 Tax=Cichlidogyrus casuarinus TaxID=1844966 RepID=A0ABD2QHF7_9PLAT
MDVFPMGGFSFENCARNELIMKKGIQMPKTVKTGTTIVGLLYTDGVVLAADTRSTSGNIVAEKNCEKIHYISPNIYCCGAGTAADTEKVTEMVSSNMELHTRNTGRQARPISVLRSLKQHLFNYQGHIGAALVVGGVDFSGPHLYTIDPHGSTSTLPFVAMGSGCLAALSVLETSYKPSMNREEAIKLARDAIASGIFNDMGSGSNVDICVITKNKTDFLRNYDVVVHKGVRSLKYLPNNQTEVVRKNTKRIDYDIITTRIIRDVPSGSTSEPMEVAM